MYASVVMRNETNRMTKGRETMNCTVDDCCEEVVTTIDGDSLCDTHAAEVSTENERSECDADAAWESMRDYD